MRPHGGQHSIGFLGVNNFFDFFLRGAHTGPVSRVSRYVRRGYLYRRRMGRHVSMSPDPGPPGSIYWAVQRGAGQRAVVNLHTDNLRVAVRRAAQLVDALDCGGTLPHVWTDWQAFLRALETAGKQAGRRLLQDGRAR